MHKNTRIISCHNLRQTEQGFLEPATMPATVITDGWRMAAVIGREWYGREVRIVRKGTEIGIVNRGIVVSKVDLGTDDFRLSAESGRLVVRVKGRVRAFCINEGILEEVVQPMPQPRLYTQIAGQVQAQAAAVKLSRVYSDGEPLSASDASRLAGVASEVYTDLDRACREAGAFMMPMLMACRLIDREGRAVYTSVPKLMFASETGAIFDGSVDFHSDDNQTVKPVTVNRPVWRVVLDWTNVPEEVLAEVNGYACEVLAIKPFHRVDPAGGYMVSGRRKASDAYSWRAQAKSAPTAVWPGAPASSHDLLSRAVAAFNDSAGVVARYEFGRDSGREKIVRAPIEGSVAGDISFMKRAVAGARTAGVALPWLSTPHTFSSRVCAEGPVATLHSDLTVRPFDGFAVEMFAATFDPLARAWTAKAVVEFDDGSVVTANSSGQRGAPMLIGAVVGYPSPRAKRMHISVDIQGWKRYATIDLSPDPSGCCAVGFSANLSPFTLSDGEMPEIAGSEALWSYPGLMAVTHRDGATPCLIQKSPGGIRAIIPARHGQGAWDYGRARFLVFSDSGISSASCAADLASLSISSIDSRVLVGEGAVVAGGDKVYAVAGTDVVEISGTRTSTLARAEGAEAIGWDATRRELWLIAPGTDVRIMAVGGGVDYTLGVKLDPNTVTRAGGNSYALTEAGVCHEIGSSTVTIAGRFALRCRSELDGVRPWRTLILDAAGHLPLASVTVESTFLNRKSALSALSMTLSGVLKAALRRPLVLRSASCDIELAGQAGSDFVIKDLSVL